MACLACLACGPQYAYAMPCSCESEKEFDTFLSFNWLQIQTVTPKSTESRHHPTRASLNLERLYMESVSTVLLQRRAGDTCRTPDTTSMVVSKWSRSRNSSLRATSFWQIGSTRYM